MADIQRAIKTYGTRTFVDERAAAPGNKAPILSLEVDKDFDTLYNAWNTGANVKPGSITNGMLGPSSVNLNNMAPNSVDSSKIVNGSIGADDLGTDSVTTIKIKDGNVTREKLAAGAPLWDLGFHSRSRDALDIGFTGGNQAGYLSLSGAGAIKSHGAGLGAYLTVRIYLMGTAVIGGGIGSDVHARLMRDGALVFDIYGFAQAWAAGGVPQELPWTIYHETVVGTPDSLDHNYTVDVLKLPGVSDQGRLRAGNIAMIAYT